MNITATPQIIPISWNDYLTRNFDRSIIPWEQYRYSGTGVIEVVGESIQTVEIADALRDRLKAEIKRLGTDWKTYQNSISIEVERSSKQERIPDILVIDGATRRLIGDESRMVTRDMPAPTLAVEVISPSSQKDDLKEKPFEYMERGVGEYVSIDWRAKVVTVWSRTDGKSYNYCQYTKTQSVVLESFPDLGLTVNELIVGS